MFKNMMNAINNATKAFRDSMKEDNNMNETIIDTTAVEVTDDNATNNEATNNKEDKTMTREEKRAEIKARFEQRCKEEGDKAEARCKAMGKGIGFAVSTVEDETKGIVSKVSGKINDNRYVKATKDGYAEGREAGHTAYQQRVEKRAEQKAVTELVKDVMDKVFKQNNADDICGDGVWNGTTAQ